MRLAAGKGQVDSVASTPGASIFALLGKDGSLLGNPRTTATRTPRASWSRLRPRQPRGDFRRTGIQFMRFNTLFQLLALQKRLAAARRRPSSAVHSRPVPSLFHRPQVNELTDASTSQMLDPATCSWATTW